MHKKFNKAELIEKLNEMKCHCYEVNRKLQPSTLLEVIVHLNHIGQLDQYPCMITRACLVSKTGSLVSL